MKKDGNVADKAVVVKTTKTADEKKVERRARRKERILKTILESSLLLFEELETKQGAKTGIHIIRSKVDDKQIGRIVKGKFLPVNQTNWSLKELEEVVGFIQNLKD